MIKLQIVHKSKTFKLNFYYRGSYLKGIFIVYKPRHKTTRSLSLSFFSKILYGPGTLIGVHTRTVFTTIGIKYQRY